MPSYSNFQDDYTKHVDSQDIFKRPASNIIERDFDADREHNLMDWITFYRRNMHRFVEHYFGIKLYFYQIIWFYLMSSRDSYVAICSRAAAKTWLLAVLALARAVLYPNSEIVVVSSTKEQAGIIVADKITSMRNDYPNVDREIKNITTNMNKWQVDFHNGSVIKVVASRDSARGKRATFIIYEEFRLIDKEVIDAVIRPFAYIRQTPYIKLKEYEFLAEEPKEVFISSAYHKGLWWYEETKKNIRDMLAGGNAGFIALDYSVALKHNIKTARQIRNEISKMDEITALEEYYNIPFGENASSYFRLRMFERGRNLKQAFYPQRDETYNVRKNPYNIPATKGEIRLVSCDIAQRAGKANDLSVTSCIRLLPTSRGYARELVYMESFSGESSITQSLRIKRVFHDFEADVLVLDIAQSGSTMYDQFGIITKDEERGIEYPAMTTMWHDSMDDKTYEELKNRTLGLNAIPNIFPISTSAKLNTEIAVQMKDKLQKKMWGFLVDEIKAEDYLIRTSKGEFLKHDDLDVRAFFLNPYIQTSLFINESINLSMVLSAANIKLEESSGALKDRYTSVSYGNYYASLLDAELLKQTGNESEWETIESLTFVF